MVSSAHCHGVNSLAFFGCSTETGKEDRSMCELLFCAAPKKIILCIVIDHRLVPFYPRIRIPTERVVHEKLARLGGQQLTDGPPPRRARGLQAGRGPAPAPPHSGSPHPPPGREEGQGDGSRRRHADR